MKTASKLLIGLGVIGLTACASSQEQAKPILQLSAADEILRISTTWSSALPEQGLLSPPSPISVFKTNRKSHVVLREKSGEETLVIDELVQLRAGTEVSCSTEVQLTLGVRYGRRGDESAVELTRPALSTPRNCRGEHPEPMLNEPSRKALFVLRADTLVAIEPPLEKRKYLPTAH